MDDSGRRAAPHPAEDAGAPPAVPLSVFFARHAHAVPIAPDDADPPLSATGRAQAERLATFLARERFLGAYISSLRRARETAARILLAAPETAGEITDDLQEVSPWHLSPDTRGSREGPSVLDLERDAMQRFANRLLHDYPSGGQVLVVAHGNIIRCLLAIMAGREPRESMPMRLHHTSLTVLDLMPSGRAVLRFANVVEHLPVAMITEDDTPTVFVPPRPRDGCSPSARPLVQ